MDISLTPELENFVQQKIASGSFKSPNEVINASLRLLQKYDEGKLKALREDIMAAYEQSQRGEATPLDIEAIIAEETALFAQNQKEKLNGKSR